MPDIQQPQERPYVNLDDKPFRYQDSLLPTDEAVQRVIQTFDQLESERYKNYDTRWLECDNLYLGVVAQHKWEGSNVWRSAVPNNLSFDHVEAGLAYVESAIFDNPEWFSCEAIMETDPREARDVNAVLERDMTIPYEENYSTVTAEMRLAFKSALTYGTGMILLEWDGKRPRWTNLDLRNVYVDYGLKTPRIDDARCIIIRDKVTVEDLERFRDDPKVKLPKEEILWWMVRNSQPALADNAQQQRELMRGALQSASMNEEVPNPSDNLIEILRYYNRGRIIWVLNRMHAMLNIPNPYRTIPILSCPCRPQLGRFYGSGLPEAIKYQQRVAEALGNAHLDELHLALDPPVTGPRDVKPSDLITRPGMRRIANDPKNVVAQPPPNSTKEVIGEITYWEQMAERRNGLSGLAQGAARPGNINRTRAGVQAQAEGTNLRLKHFIENIRDYMIIPGLYKMIRFYQVHTTPDQVIMAEPARDGRPAKIITAAIFHKPVQFIMDAAARMVTRDRLGSTLAPALQYMVNGAVMQGLASIGMTLDFSEIAKAIQDAAGIPRRYVWVRPMTQQEQQQLNQPPPEAMMQAQAKQSDQQLRMQIAGMKQQTDMAAIQAELQKAQIQKAPSPFEVQAQQQKAQIEQQSLMAKLSVQQQSDQQKLEMQRQKMMMDMIGQRQKIEGQAKEAQMDAAVKQSEAQSKIQQHVMSMQMMQEQREQMRAEHAKDRTAGMEQKPKGANNT